MLTATQSRRVERYLAELAAALGRLPEAERADVVAGVSEHIQASLADRPAVTDADIEQVLRALGDPLTIAAEATADEDEPPPATDQPRRDVPALQRDWVPGAVVAALVLGPLVLPFFISFGGILALPLVLLSGWAALWISPLWTPGEKLAGTFLLPGAGATFLVFSVVSSSSSEVCTGWSTPDGEVVETCSSEGGGLVTVVAWPILIALAIASVVTAVVLYRRGRVRAAEAAQSFSTGA